MAIGCCQLNGGVCELNETAVAAVLIDQSRAASN